MIKKLYYLIQDIYYIFINDILHLLKNITILVILYSYKRKKKSKKKREQKK